MNIRIRGIGEEVYFEYIIGDYLFNDNTLVRNIYEEMNNAS